jgi:hypothetical protein
LNAGLGEGNAEILFRQGCGGQVARERRQLKTRVDCCRDATTKLSLGDPAFAGEPLEFNEIEPDPERVGRATIETFRETQRRQLIHTNIRIKTVNGRRDLFRVVQSAMRFLPEL